MSKSLKLGQEFDQRIVITALDLKGARVYYTPDSGGTYSSGYPYWGQELGRTVKFKSSQQAAQDFEKMARYMTEGHTEIQIIEVQSSVKAAFDLNASTMRMNKINELQQKKNQIELEIKRLEEE